MNDDGAHDEDGLINQINLVFVITVFTEQLLPELLSKANSFISNIRMAYQILLQGTQTFSSSYTHLQHRV